MIISTIFRNRTTQKILRVVVPLAFWLGAWQLAAIWVDTVYTPGHGALLLPSPLLVWERLAALAARPSFWRTAAVSLGRIFGGFALGAAAGTLLAVITSALSWADWLFRPMVKVIRAVPVASFIVLVLLWASTGRVPAIVSGLMVLPVLWEPGLIQAQIPVGSGYPVCQVFPLLQMLRLRKHPGGQKPQTQL